MKQEEVIRKTAAYVKRTLQGEGSGHDWWHIVRVRNTALHIAMAEQANLFTVELAALLHDIADWKFNGGDPSKGANVARTWLRDRNVSDEITEHVADIIEGLSFKGAGVETRMETLEGRIVQDADRLDAMGAIGIARAFAYGGHKGREIHNPNIKPQKHKSFKAYKNSTGSSINHFYEKLLLLKDRMNTEPAKAHAESRHQYMEEFLNRFHQEWSGEL